MVLIKDNNDGSQVKQMTPKNAARVHPVIDIRPPTPGTPEQLDSHDSHDDEGEEYDDFDYLEPERTSINTDDDSIYPEVLSEDYVSEERPPSPDDPDTLAFFAACSSNNGELVREMVRHGVREDTARKTDKNRRTVLLVACYHGYIDIVVALSECPHIDVNWQDKEGNTALITAGQAGHDMICSYLINYFCGVDLERRNVFGMTALMKAAVQGRVECVKILMMAGANIEAKDPGRGLTPIEWARFTGRFDTHWTMYRLLARPCALQICQTYKPEWPPMAALVAQATAPKSFLQRLTDALCSQFEFSIANVTNPEDDGVCDHLVIATTALSSPFITLACSTVCPETAPQVGKLRAAVPELVKRPDPRIAAAVARKPKRDPNRKYSLQPPPVARPSGSEADRRLSLMPVHLSPSKKSVAPGPPIPKLKLFKAPPPDYFPEIIKNRKDSIVDPHLLAPPIWKYKEKKIEKKKKEKEEKKKEKEEKKEKKGKRRDSKDGEQKKK